MANVNDVLTDIQAKVALNITGSELKHDAWLDALRIAAVQWVDEHTCVGVLPRYVVKRYQFDTFAQPLEFRLMPGSTISDAQYASGSARSVYAALDDALIAMPFAGLTYISPPGGEWPERDMDIGFKLSLPATALPAAIRAASALVLRDMYDLGEVTSHRALRALLQPYRSGIVSLSDQELIAFDRAPEIEATPLNPSTPGGTTVPDGVAVSEDLLIQHIPLFRQGWVDASVLPASPQIGWNYPVGTRYPTRMPAFEDPVRRGRLLPGPDNITPADFTHFSRLNSLAIANPTGGPSSTMHLAIWYNRACLSQTPGAILGRVFIDGVDRSLDFAEWGNLSRGGGSTYYWPNDPGQLVVSQAPMRSADVVGKKIRLEFVTYG